MPTIKLFVIKNEYDFYFSEIMMLNDRFVGAGWVSSIQDCASFQSEDRAKSVIRTIRELIEWEPVVADYDVELAKAEQIAVRKNSDQKILTQYEESEKVAGEKFSQVLSWNSSALMVLVQKNGGRVAFTREELSQLEEQRRTGALELVFKEAGNNIVVVVES
jgi:hypothetical protein